MTGQVQGGLRRTSEVTRAVVRASCFEYLPRLVASLPSQVDTPKERTKMNFKIAFVGAALMAFGGIFAVGCGGNDCEAAADSQLAKFESCPDFVKPAETSSTTGTTVECTDALGVQLNCLAACTNAASCECLGLDKSKTCSVDDLTKQAKCSSDCSATAAK